MPIRISILGATGSIGRSALDVVRHYPDKFDVVGLAAHSNVDLLARQIAEFKPRTAAMTDEAAASALKNMFPDLPVLPGEAGIEEQARAPADVVLCAMVGAAGLKPVLKAIDAGNRVALANKEPMVMAGKLIMERARARNVRVLPVDSEHNAIFQCLEGHQIDDVRCIHLTASGGPFYGRPRPDLESVTAAEATRHPTWDMGAKISVDSATLMNKGLEVIEAMWLFGLPLEKIEVIIHPQSIVHSLVEFTDGSILAHLGVTDMKFPILFALTWPERVGSPIKRLDLAHMKPLTFAAPDFSEFPCLRHALEAAKAGGTTPAVLNAANEVAVKAFCRGDLAFLAISEVVRETLEQCPANHAMDLESILHADTQARQVAHRLVKTRGVLPDVSL